MGRMPDNDTDAIINRAVHEFSAMRYDSARQLCEKSIHQNPDNIAAYSILAGIYSIYGDKDKAMKALDTSLNINKSDPSTYVNRATILSRFNDDDRALLDLDCAIAMDSNCFDAFYKKGIILLKLEKYRQALNSLSKARTLEPDRGELYIPLAKALIETGSHQPALDAYDISIKLNYRAQEAYNAKGTLLVQLGQLEDAEASYRCSLEQGNNIAAHAGLSGLKTYRNNDADIDQIKALFNSWDLTAPANQSNTHLSAQHAFVMAKVCNDLGDYERAFLCYEKGNKLRKSHLGYQIESDQSLIEAIIGLDKQLCHTSTTPLDTRGKTPIFIVGLPRSGTTLIEQILSSHEDVHPYGEVTYASKAFFPVVNRCHKDMNIINDSAMFNTLLHNAGELYLDQALENNSGQPYFTDKMPDNFLWLGLIVKALPAAKFIIVERDKKATAWSLFKSNFNSSNYGYAYSLDDIKSYFNLYDSLVDYWLTKYPEHIKVIKYEKLVDNPTENIKTLLEHCQLDWDERCVEFNNTQRIVRTASAAQVVKPIYKNSNLEHLNYMEHLQDIVTKQR